MSKLNRLHGAISGAAHLLAGIGKSGAVEKLASGQRDRVVNMLLAHAQSQMTTSGTSTGATKFDGKSGGTGS